MNFPGGVCWFYGQQIPQAMRDTLDAEWVGGFGTGEGLADFPQSVSSNVQPFAASVSASNHTFKLHYNTTIAQDFFVTPPTSGIHLKVALDETTTDVELIDNSIASLSNKVVWIDDEAILLGSISGGVYQNCVRGIYGTYAKTHEVGSIAWKKNPRRTGRLVRQLRLDLDTGIVTQRWQGLLSGDPETSSNGTQLILRADEVIAAVSGGVLNRGSESIPAGAVVIHNNGKIQGNTGPASIRVMKNDGSSKNIWYQVNESLVRASNRPSNENVRFLNTGPVEGPSFSKDEIPEKIFEILAIHPGNDIDSGAFPASATRDLDYPYHPVAIAMALLCSDDSPTVDGANYNVLGGAWGGGLPIEWFDRARIDALILDTSHIKIDVLVLGWDGEEVSPWEFSKELFRLYGFFWGRSEEGKILVSRYREATISDFTAAPKITVYPPMLKMRSAHSETIETISGTIGALPWSDGVSYSVQSTAAFKDNNSARAGFLSQARESSLNIPTKIDPIEVIEALGSIGDARQQNTPRFKFRAEAGEYHHGQFIVIKNPAILVDWFVDNEGIVSDVTNSPSFIGLVVGINELTKEPAVELEVMLTNHSTGELRRLRAPSAVVISASGATLTIESSEFTTTGDGLEFVVGDKVELHDGRGARRAGVGVQVRTVSAIAAGSLTLNTAFTTTPNFGDVIRLAHLSDAAGTENDSTPYVFLGDNTGDVGADSYDAHKYALGIL